MIKLVDSVCPGCSRLVDRTEDDVVIGSAVEWQSGRHLDYWMLLNELNQVAYLDGFLPRVLHLVEHPE